MQKITSEADILALIAADAAMRRIIDAVRSLDLPDWYIGAGFIRSKVWDCVQGNARPTPLTDIDVVYYDRTGTLLEKEIERQLTTLVPEAPWEATNQATVERVNGARPYLSSEDAIAHWPETATAIGVTTRSDELVLVAPHGIADLVDMVVRPTPWFAADAARLARVRERLAEKRWKENWPNITVEGLVARR